jgi:hypothetical protein
VIKRGVQIDRLAVVLRAVDVDGDVDSRGTAGRSGRSGRDC